MENLEKQCLENLDKILSKFDLKIETEYNKSLNVWQYRLVDKLSSDKTYLLGVWLSLNDLLFNHQSIFGCLDSYCDTANDINDSIFLPNITSPMYQRYSEAYQFLQPLKSSCLEEFLIKCDLIGI